MRKFQKHDVCCWTAGLPSRTCIILLHKPAATSIRQGSSLVEVTSEGVLEHPAIELMDCIDNAYPARMVLRAVGSLCTSIRARREAGQCVSPLDMLRTLFPTLAMRFVCIMSKSEVDLV
jgi:hypothetical protein